MSAAAPNAFADAPCIPIFQVDAVGCGSSNVIIPFMTNFKPVASIIVPAFREARNIGPLIDRTETALAAAQIRAEMIVVDDDSQDGTSECVTQRAASALSQPHLLPRITVRLGERGLSSAVLRGFQDAAADRLIVMDADLQHPPESIPDLIRALDDPDCDFVIATRYAHGGSLAAHWPWARRMASKAATLLARPLVPLTDPMSGFFGLRRSLWWNHRESCNPIGYKIALELFVKCGCRNPREIPIEFGTRTHGESKLTGMVMVKYIQHVASLYRYRLRNRRN